MPSLVLSTPAVVVSTRALGESDLLVTLFTLETGKLGAVAKGARRSRKRFMNALEPFTEISARLVKSRPSAGLWRLDSALINNSHESIRTDYLRFTCASLCLELVDLWQKEGIRDMEVFDLTRWYLAGLASGAYPVASSLVFKTRLLKAVGLMPRLSRCRVCGRAPQSTPVGFDRATGEIFCLECGGTAKGGRLGLGTARSLDFIGRTGLENVSRLRFTQVQVREGWEYIKQLHCRHLQKEARSYKLIDLSKDAHQVQA